MGEPSQKFQGVSINTRTLKPGELFFCIQGDQFDGHDFLSDAIEKKAAGVVVSDRTKLDDSLAQKSGIFAVAVPDTIHALQELAGYHRRQFSIRMIGVTGTNGKSTTKEMIVSVMKLRYPTLKTEGNLNNHIGLPLTLLGLNKSHKAAVVEMGMSAAGEIARLAEIAQPRIGVITNISQAHIIEFTFKLQQGGLIKMMVISVLLGEKPVLHWNQVGLASYQPLFRFNTLFGRYGCCEFSNSLVAKYLFGRQLQALFGCTGNDLNAQDRVSTQVKKIIMDADSVST